MYMIIGYSLLCCVMSTYAAHNDEIEQRYARVKLKLAYQGKWLELWDLSQGYKEHHLLEASKVCDWQKVKEIVTKHHKGISLDACDGKGNFSLWCAVRAKKYDVIQLLLEHGADPNQALCCNGSTALFEAVYQSDIDAALVLLDRGADLNVSNSMGVVPLLAAVQADCVPMVQLLLMRGAHPNVQEKKLCINGNDTGGDTPLIFAATKNNIEIVRLLLSAGAHNIEASNSSGQTAHSQAKFHHNKEMLELLNRAQCRG